MYVRKDCGGGVGEIFLALFKEDKRLGRKSFHLNSKFDLGHTL